MGHHQVLLVSRAGNLRLHRQVIRLVLLLAEPEHDLIDYLVCRIGRLAIGIVLLDQI